MARLAWLYPEMGSELGQRLTLLLPLSLLCQGAQATPLADWSAWLTGMKYEADDTYITDTSGKDSLLGCGGCFTRVER